jgi:uridine kinase
MPRIILVGGGSSSGKSYLSKKVIEEVGGSDITHLTLDDYYKDQSTMSMAERLKVNYDHPRAFDWKLMREQVASLKEGKAIKKPIYDFVARTRSEKVETIVPKKLIVIEGIMALVDKELRNLGDLRVFIRAGAERRFLRRLLRDHEERGREFEGIVKQYFSSVQPMYDEIVEPSSIYADLIVNNDGVSNLAVDVLACLFRKELEWARQGKTKEESQEEFSSARLNGVFASKE